MADNQHMRNQYRADTEDKDDDPLAELFRIVGVDEDEEISAAASGEKDAPEFSFDLESELFGDMKEDDDSDAGHVVPELNPESSVAANADDVQIDIEETIAAAILSDDSEPVFTGEGVASEPEVDGPVAEQPDMGSDFADVVGSAEANDRIIEADTDPVEPDIEAIEQEIDAELPGEREDENGLQDADDEGQTSRSDDARSISPEGSERTGDLPGVDFDALFAGGINDGEADSDTDDDNSLERTSHLREELVRDIEEQSGFGDLVQDDRGTASAAQTWNSKGDMNRPPDDTKAGGEPESEFWPNAKREENEEILSLEAELQAAFDALEGKSASGSPVQNEPAATAVPFTAAAAPYSAPTQPDDGATFSAALEQLQNAGRTGNEQPQEPPASPEPQNLQEREAPKMPLASNLADSELPSRDEGEMPLGDLLAAEMAAIENLAAEASERVDEIPFNPADIYEDDSVPDDVGAVEVPDQQGEEPKASVALDEDLNISLEDELAALSAEAQDHGYVQTDLHSEEEYYAEHADPAVAAELAAHASALSHEFGSHEARLDDEAAAPDWDDQSLDDDSDAPATGIGYEAEEDARQEWQPDEQEFDAGFAAVDFSDIEEPSEPNRPGRTLYTLLAAIVAIALVGGAGLYFWNSSIGEDGAGGEPPIITAETDPVKIKPEDPGGTTVPNQDLAVYDRVSGTSDRTPRQENLVSTEEEPVDIVQRTLDPDTLPLEGRNATEAVDGTKADDRLVAGESIDPDPAATSSGDSIGITPTRVRTLIVKPDGTIVSREQEPGTVELGMTAANSAVSGDMPVTTKAGPETALAVGEPAMEAAAVPETGAGIAATDGGASAGTASALPPIEENLRDSGEPPVPVARPTETAGATATAAVQADGATAESANATNLRSSIAVPVPTPRPADQPVNIVEAVTERGNLAGSTNTAGAGGYLVQISSQVTEEGARADYERQARTFASVIGGYGVDIQKADIPGRGVFYRVRIPAGSKQAATDLCERLIAAGGNCFVAR